VPPFVSRFILCLTDDKASMMQVLLTTRPLAQKNPAHLADISKLTSPSSVVQENNKICGKRVYYLYFAKLVHFADIVLILSIFYTIVYANVARSFVLSAYIRSK